MPAPWPKTTNWFGSIACLYLPELTRSLLFDLAASLTSSSGLPQREITERQDHVTVAPKVRRAAMLRLNLRRTGGR